ncbi:MAG: hypothetical protein GY737_30815 [Desulfobacteraceae bacterium]|nr:hypothetical protein [Desulfobacteraceae bacterium]
MLGKNRAILFVLVVFSLIPVAFCQAANPENIKQVYDNVQTAVSAIEKNGPAIYPELAKLNSPYNKGSYYIFVVSLEEGKKGEFLAHPTLQLVGRNIMTLKEPRTNRKFGQEIVQIAESPEGCGWTTYYWVKPDVKKILPKASYIMKVPGMPVAVGAGIYEVTKEEAERVIK